MHIRTGVLSRFAWSVVSLAAAAAMATACGGTTAEQIVGPTGSRCQIAVADPPPVPATPSNVPVNVSAARDCTWTVASEAPWVTVSPASGQGSATIVASVAANAIGTPRSSAIAVNDVLVTLTQQGVPCRFELGDQSARVGPAGARRSIHLTTIAGCAWEASSPVEWVRVITPAGTGSGTIELDISRNDGDERSTALSIAGIAFVVSQESPSRTPGPAPGGPTDPPPPPATSCSYSIEPQRAVVRAAAGQVSVRVNTQTDCQWTASASTSWISLAGSEGKGAGTVSYHVSANTSTVSDRTGSVSIAGRTHSVTQEACELSIEGGLSTLPAESGTYNFQVTTSPGCTWTAQSSVSWISVATRSGTGTSSVSYSLQANPDRGREGTIVVSGRVKAIVQYGAQ